MLLCTPLEQRLLPGLQSLHCHLWDECLMGHTDTFGRPPRYDKDAVTLDSSC